MHITIEEWSFWNIVVGIAISLLISLPFFFLLRKTLFLINSKNRKLPLNSLWLFIFPYVGPFYSLFLTMRLSESIDLEIQDRGILRKTRVLKATGVLHSAFSIYLVFFSSNQIVGMMSLCMFILFWIEVYRIFKFLSAPTQHSLK